MKGLIFGINGQDGYYLSRLLLENKIEVLGISRSEGQYSKGDVSDYQLVSRTIEKEKPDFIFHLAANSTTKHEVLFENHEIISTGTLNILESVYKYSPLSKVFLSGSAVQFENSGKPISEKTPFSPISAYAVSRINSVYAARYFRKMGVKVYIGYLFNHDSPYRTERHVNQMLVKTIKRIASGSKEKIEIGDMEVKKEFNFAGDIVNAIYSLVNQEHVFEAVIGSGEAHSIKEWIEYCCSLLKVDMKGIVIEKENFISEYRILVSDPKLIKSLGWEPKVNFYQLAELMIK
jgi:GDPmannose 4,6-dehydratase